MRLMARARRAEFMISAAGPEGFPPAQLPEFAFSGRSNVGKSTLLNALVGVSGLARTSRTPGRTRLLNWFRVEPPSGPPVAFVDLPGYGYARVPVNMRQSWRPLVEAYLTRRAVLRVVFVLVDARRGADSEERELLEYLDELGVAAQVVLTKADKLPKARRKLAAVAVRRDLGLKRDPILASAPEREGLAELWKVVGRYS
jgi:GTP-binding protein